MRQFISKLFCKSLIVTVKLFSTFNLISIIWPNWLGLKNTSSASLQRGKTPPNQCPEYDLKQSDGDTVVMVELWGIRSSPILSSLPDPLWQRGVASDRVLLMGKKELN